MGLLADRRWANRGATRSTIYTPMHSWMTKSTASLRSVIRSISIRAARPQGPTSTVGSSWGDGWLTKYIPHRDSYTGPLPSEVQRPWGSVLVDPHWSHVQVYETPIPLWPHKLVPGWRAYFNTKYKTPVNDAGLPWEQKMNARDWEMITVPAGQFRALRFSNIINFRSDDFSRADSQRQETVWIAPEVGRWIARESWGTYYIDDSAADTPYNESAYRWELLEWT